MTVTPYQRVQCERLARSIWAEREKAFPRFVQQTWEQGTHLAQDATFVEAARRLGLIPAIVDGTATAAANEDLPVPQDCQARCEAIAQPLPQSTRE